MRKQERADHWQRVYEEKQETEVSWFQAEPAVSLDLIASCNLHQSEHMIDVGGGASVLVDRLLAIGYKNLTVLDISSAALTKSRERLGETGAGVQWLVSDITKFKSQQQYALWHDRAVFHFLTSAADRQAYISALKQALPVGGHLIIAAFALGGPEKCSGLPVVQYDANRLMAEIGAEFELIEERVEEHVTPAQTIQKFAYFRCKRCLV